MTRTLSHAGCLRNRRLQIENKTIYKRDFKCDYYKIVVASDGFGIMSRKKKIKTIMDTIKPDYWLKWQ